MIPGRGVPLDVLAVRSNELLLLYSDERARAWDMGSLELRRSIGLDQALALFDDGRGWWAQHQIGPQHLRTEKGSVGVLRSVPTCRGRLAGTMTADFRRAITAASRMVTPLHSGISNARDLFQPHISNHVETDMEPPKDLAPNPAAKAIVPLPIDAPQSKKALHTLRPLLRCLLPFGFDNEIDKAYIDILGGDKMDRDEWVTLGTHSDSGFLAMTPDTSSLKASFSVSSGLTCARLISLVSILLVLSNISGKYGDGGKFVVSNHLTSELQASCHELIVLLGSLSTLLGDTFQNPPLSFLADYLMDQTRKWHCHRLLISH